MEFKAGDLVLTPHGNGYINEIIGDQVVVDLVDGDHQRQMFNSNEISLSAE